MAGWDDETAVALAVPLVFLAGSQYAAGTLGMHASVLPGDPVVAIFDTGAAVTEVAAAALGGHTGETAVGGRSVSGVELEAAELRSQVLAVADARLDVVVLSVRDHVPVPEGAADHEVPEALIGMDLVKGTALVIGPRAEASVLWIVPAQQAGRRPLL